MHDSARPSADTRALSPLGALTRWPMYTKDWYEYPYRDLVSKFRVALSFDRTQAPECRFQVALTVPL